MLYHVGGGVVLAQICLQFSAKIFSWTLPLDLTLHCYNDDYDDDDDDDDDDGVINFNSFL